MPTLLKNIRGAVGLGLAWLLVGALIGFVVFEGFVDPHGEIEDIWPAVLGFPGFFGGVIFFALFTIFERGRRLRTVSLSRAAVWGALSGPLLIGLFVVAMAMGLGDWEDGRTPWPELARLAGLLMVVFAVAGCVSVWTARKVAARAIGRHDGR